VDYHAPNKEIVLEKKIVLVCSKLNLERDHRYEWLSKLLFEVKAF
jgi:hypothetical protein